MNLKEYKVRTPFIQIKCFKMVFYPKEAWIWALVWLSSTSRIVDRILIFLYDQFHISLAHPMRHFIAERLTIQ